MRVVGRYRWLWLIFVVGVSGCFSKYRITESDVRRHYEGVKNRPRVKIIQNDSLRLRVVSAGADTLPMLLLIHGAPGAWWGYMNMLDDPELQKRFHIVAVDRPGYGHSKLRKHRFVTSIEMQARCLMPLLELNKSAEKVVVLGRSYGAPIAAYMSTLAPEKISQLILVSPVIDPDRERFYWFSKWGRNPLIQLFLPWEFNVATAEKYKHASELQRILPMWKNVTVPTTVIQGGKDWIGDPANIDFAKKHIASSNSQYILIPNAGHMLTSTHTEMIKAMVLRTSLFRSNYMTLNTSELIAD
jgi:pimeloyl-ACP methyl ester carboxylesterase